jgi:hypothetical protein
LSLKRHQFRAEWISELSTYLSKPHTPIEVKETILTNLGQWLEPSNIIDLTVDTNIKELDKAIHQQQLIGWRHFTQGRLSIAWGTTINRHLEKEKIYHLTAEKWAADLLSIHWKHILKIWREPCLDVHSSSPDEIEQKTKQRYLTDIHHIQSINQNLSHSQHDWILEDIDQLRL